MPIDPASIKRLRSIPAFCKFAERKMADEPEFYVHEAKFGTGILRELAAAVVEIGGDAV